VAAKKKSAKKGAKKKGAAQRPCKPKDICNYLKALDAWLHNDFLPQHLKVTHAVCNLDKVAIRLLPNTPNAMLCPGTGGVVEPPVAPPPPKW
jgi:hypothetical protein